MTFEKIILLLGKRLKTRRTYEIPTNGRVITLQQEYENQCAADPDTQRNQPVYHPRQKRITCSDMCINGPGAHAELCAQWGIIPPADYLKFCALFSEYIIAGRMPIRILCAQEIRDDDGIRDAWDVPKSERRRLLYFARVVEEPAHFAFRWNDDCSKVDIVYSWDYGDIGEPILLGEDGNRFVSDLSFTAWLQRMLETDCHPLFTSRKIPTSSGWIRQDRAPWNRVE